MTLIVVFRDKECISGTTSKVYKKIQNVTNAQKEV
jgi:hypothetical protein